MNIFIAGGGRVGFHLAHLLSVEGHDVTIIDKDVNRIEQADYALDVQTLTGDAVSVMLLKEIGVASADVFVAAMGTDELNLISAATAKGLGAKQVVARVDDANYIESNILYETVLNIDYLLSPEALTALEIARFIDNPGMVAVEDFGRGLVQMRQIRAATAPGDRLKDVCPPGCGVLFGVISRNGKSFIPHGETVVQTGDLVTLIGRRGKLEPVQRQFQAAPDRTERVVIMGGGSIGLHLAQLLDGRSISAKLLDWNMDRCSVLAAKLRKVKVVCRDATSRSSLEQEHINDVDLFVATTSDDEHNIMASVLAKELGADHTVAVVHQPDFAPLVYRLGIDHAVTPRACLANRILKLVHQKTVSTLAVLEEGQVEVLEFPVQRKTAITGKTLAQIGSKMPSNSLVATILRGDDVIVPSGEDAIQVGDSVVMIASLDSVDVVQKLFGF
jgi:trk system potassium uptake protein TrkA